MSTPVPSMPRRAVTMSDCSSSSWQRICLERRTQLDGLVDGRVGAVGVGTHFDQVAGAFVLGERRPDGSGDAQVILVHDRGHGSGDGGQYVYRRVVVPLGQRARKDDVPVQNGADGVGHRFRHVVAFDEDGEEAR